MLLARPIPKHQPSFGPLSWNPFEEVGLRSVVDGEVKEDLDESAGGGTSLVVVNADEGFFVERGEVSDVLEQLRSLGEGGGDLSAESLSDVAGVEVSELGSGVKEDAQVALSNR